MSTYFLIRSTQLLAKLDLFTVKLETVFRSLSAILRGHRSRATVPLPTRGVD